jgi:hypothetical protein
VARRRGRARRARSSLAAELVALAPDIVLASGTLAVTALQHISRNSGRTPRGYRHFAFLSLASVPRRVIRAHVLKIPRRAYFLLVYDNASEASLAHHSRNAR